MEKHVTIIQIARESGVSISTVSRVLNGNVPVSESKKKRVEEVINKYQYSPNAFARSLVNKCSMTLGVILPDISNPYFVSLFLEIERHALEAGYAVLLINTLFGKSSRGVVHSKPEEDYFQIMIDKQVDGVILTGGQMDMEDISQKYVNALQRLNDRIPVVIIGKAIKDSTCIFIQRESGSGVTAVVNHLCSLGHRRIAFVGGQPGVTITSMRLASYKNALKAQGIELDDKLVFLSDYYVEDGYAAMNELLSSKVKFSAVIAINDTVAQGAQRAMADKNIAVPEDVAMVSCDAFGSASHLIPRLTNVNQQNNYIGRMAIITLISAIRGVAETIRISLTPELIVRESCGAYLGPRRL